MPRTVEELFDEFATRFRRGESPNLRAYLGRAGAEAGELANMVDAFLQAVPPPAPSDEAVSVERRRLAGESPLLVLRTQKGLRRSEIVERLLTRFRLDAQLRDKLRLRYHELETGQLDARRVDKRVWETLAEMLSATVEDLMSFARPQTELRDRMAYYRIGEAGSAPELVAPSAPIERDEVDVLFGTDR